MRSNPLPHKPVAERSTEAFALVATVLLYVHMILAYCMRELETKPCVMAVAMVTGRVTPR